MKKVPNIKPESTQIPPQALVVDYDTFYDANNTSLQIRANAGSKLMNRSSLLSTDTNNEIKKPLNILCQRFFLI